MNRFEGITKPLMLLTAMLLTAVVAGCGGQDPILGGGGSAGNPGPAGAAPALASAATFGTFGGSAGMTNTGIQTQINNGDIGTIATATGSITGFHDSNGDIYTEVLLTNIGAVSGRDLHVYHFHHGSNVRYSKCCLMRACNPSPTRCASRISGLGGKAGWTRSKFCRW